MKTIFKLILINILFFNASCGSGGKGNQDFKNLKEPTVGLAIFALNNPNFPVDEAIELLKSTKPGHRATFSVLNRTFGENLDNYNKLLAELDYLKPHVQIHATCGPCRKPRADGSIVRFAPQYDINQLNNVLSRQEQSVVAEFIKVLEDIKNNYILPHPSLTFTVTPELESNYTRNVAGIMINLALQVFAENGNVEVNFNHLDNAMRFDGIPYEIHHTLAHSTVSLDSGDLLNFDGSLFLYPSESSPQGFWKSNNIASWNEIQQTVALSIKRGAIVHLWRPEWQGLHQPPPRKSPDQREYTFWNKHEEIKLLLNIEADSVPLSEQNLIVSRNDGPGSFLWKPVSESDKNLVVLLPSHFRKRLDRVELRHSGGVENGRFTGDTMNENRVHYRFSRPGSRYGANITLVAVAKTGETYTWNIPNGGSRYD
jgi:hypothetical protein